MIVRNPETLEASLPEVTGSCVHLKIIVEIVSILLFVKGHIFPNDCNNICDPHILPTVLTLYPLSLRAYY